MEETLFLSEEIDLTFNLSDHSISSDEDLIPINSYTKTEENPINSDLNCLQNCSQYLSEDLGHKSKQNNERIETELFLNNKEKTNEISYYKECPLCKSLGPKSINHIKQCANKRSVDPKQVLQLLNKCQKSDTKSIFCNKNKVNPKQTKRSNKLNDNYIITFGNEKRLQISINPKLISDKNSKLNQIKHELSSLDPLERQKRLMNKINEQIINSLSEKCDKQMIVIQSLPPIWSFSLLDSNSDKYLVEGFEKYETNSWL